MPFSMDPFTVLIILGIAAIIIEIIIGAATGFELLVLGVVFILGGIVGMLTDSMPFALTTVVLLTLAYIFFARRLIQQSLHITTKKTNVESIIGKTARVVGDITPDEPGQVKIDGEVWRAEADSEFSKGDTVTIRSVSGVTVKVEKLT
ncbi:NfeD family protein [Candidatus Roizmanbacteria bacterium]|nr:MAG: NfeD family protein [Candidatus Roizmanbacteria bacterium]